MRREATKKEIARIRENEWKEWKRKKLKRTKEVREKSIALT